MASLTRPKPPLAVTAALGLAACAALVMWRRTFREFVDYRVENPETMPFDAAPCSRVGLVAWWPLDSLNGAESPDQGGLGHTLHAARSFAPLAALRFPYPSAAAGHLAGSLQFSTNQWLIGPNGPCFASEAAGVTAWVWMDAAAHVPTIVAKSAWPSDGWWLLTTTLDPFGSDRFLELGLASGSGFFHVKSGYQMPLNAWHHVAVSMDNAAHEVRFFVDGEAFGPVHSNVPPWLVNWTHGIVVGDYDGSGRWPWDGRIDDVRVFNRALTGDDVRRAFRGEAP